ncbi:surface polysaccharide O-acyltransferase-like enzyme [Roseivirga pacifica]|jgi:hypothetical protein|uniref:Surface polysaccharide O-acyltransferase, integral membrane enzyme n=1 Tax=Roseivirga pacifica TaxID=1267423 RepID=A0A1I0NM81_9BACT|nr:acyltransferase family protein [Roseivirga sp.]RKQ51304.1 surface polysaccharide O-acyltransferase-like enzyme [Roseivirga pacifica]SEW02431.1 Surface polysaccharide O-acyltransferase, integral membrane enzyme [Roseivirga pacifica]
MSSIERYQSIDFLKLSLAIMVVAVHCGFLFEFNDLFFHLTSSGIFRITVPAFAVISGYFIYGKLDKLNFQLWTKRMVSLYLVWTVIYSPFILTSTNLLRLIIDLLFGYFHLWYLAALIGGGFLLFILKDLTDLRLLLLSIITFLVGVFFQYAAEYDFFGSTHLITKILTYKFLYRNFLFFGFPFLTLGYLIRKNRVASSIRFNSAILLVLILAVFYLVECLIYFKKLSGDYSAHDVYLLSFLLCPAILILAIKMNSSFSNFQTKRLNAYFIGIYLVHPIFIMLYSKSLTLNSIYLFGMVLISSIIATYFLIQIKRRFKYIL